MAVRFITANLLIGDVRIWFCVIVMLLAMLVYVATSSLRWRIHGRPQQSRQPISAPAGN